MVLWIGLWSVIVTFPGHVIALNVCVVCGAAHCALSCVGDDDFAILIL